MSTSGSTLPHLELGSTPVGSSASPVPPLTLDGRAVYTQYCSSCHADSKRHSAAFATQEAIDEDVGGMGVLKSLTPARVAAIAAAP
jgi:hypothetical protein